MAGLKEKIKEQENDGKLLNERNKQVHSLEKDLAIKEDTIHKLLAENEQSQILASQVRMHVQNMGYSQTVLPLCSVLLCRSLSRLSRPTPSNSRSCPTAQ